VRLTLAETDTILAHCIARAVIADAGGEEGAKERYGENAEALKGAKWTAFKVAARVTPKASRVASFIGLWGLAMYDLGVDELSVDEYAEWANESRATAFRRAAEYRELWPELDVNALAGLVRDQIRSNVSLRKNPSRLTSVAIAV
jgi:hypothetical protein